MAFRASSSLTAAEEKALMLKVMLGQCSTQTCGVLQPSMIDASKEVAQAKMLKKARYLRFLERMKVRLG